MSQPAFQILLVSNDPKLLATLSSVLHADNIAFALERRQPDSQEDVWLLSQVWLQRFAYRQLFSVVLFKTIKRAIEGQRFAWDKLERTAAVSYTPSENHDSVNVP